MANTSQTDHGLFVRVADDLLEVQLQAGVLINADTIAAIMRERIRACGRGPLCVLVRVPSDADLDLAVMGTDHYQVNDSSEGLRAVAIVAGSLVLETVARLYAAYFPPLFRFEVFSQETDAREWLNGHLSDLRQTGGEPYRTGA